ncbi:hypothetical protein [Legionella qingyii]|uniref:hypothetical protein n=1 Tax=Legionella qingyii TaxID=2184757 RepID=UPI0014036DAB|nr:hypothetical protein [Legionella qingyii]
MSNTSAHFLSRKSINLGVLTIPEDNKKRKSEISESELFEGGAIYRQKIIFELI